MSLSEKRVTRSSLGTNQVEASSSKEDLSSKKPKELRCEEVKIDDTSKAQQNLSRKSARRSESSTNTQLDQQTNSNASSQNEIGQNEASGEIKRSKRLIEQKSFVFNKFKAYEDTNSNETSAQILNNPTSEQITEVAKNEPLNAQTKQTNEEIDSKIVTRRRSTNILNLRSGSSSSLLSQSLNLGKKRNLNQAIDLSSSLKLPKNESEVYFENEDSNSSSINLPHMQPTTSTNTNPSNLIKRLKSKQSNLSTTTGATSRSSLLRSKDETGSSAIESNTTPYFNNNPDENESDNEELFKCPIKDCNSAGHLDGVSEKHSTFDTCPKYLEMTVEDSAKRRENLDKILSEASEKSKKIIENRKSLRNRNVGQEQTEYFKVVEAQLNKKIRNSSSPNKHSIHQILSPETLSDIKNLTTSFIINSISANIAPSNLTNTLIVKPNSLINTLTGLNKTDQAPIIDDLDVSEFDLNIFKDVLVMSSQEKLPIEQEKPLKLFNISNKLIQFGNYEIETWYKSPYPDDFWQLGKIFICQYCLNYMKSHTVLDRHLEKCVWRHPPGREIYRKEKYSFFEVDGKYNKIYCQNLCLLAKLFLDHKTLYYDVEPFLFYVLTEYNEVTGSFQTIGYFSKEKQSVMNYNLSCILILPPYMNKGFGRLLIDFSYLLSRVEEKIGSPEKPLSDLGLISYRSYWKHKLLTYVYRHWEDIEISIKEISLESGILANDIISTFQYIGLIKYWKGKHIIIKDKELIEKYAKKKYPSYLDADPTCLKWSPYVYQTIIDEHELLPHSKYGNKFGFGSSCEIQPKI